MLKIAEYNTITGKKVELSELWKPIKGYEDKYEISNYGRVRSLPIKSKNKDTYRTVKGKILKPNQCRGYYTIGLLKNGKFKTLRIHRLVAQTFIENKNNYPAVNHIDGNKKNNRVDNLEWCTYSHNIKEAFRLGLKKPSEKQKEVVRQYCKKNKTKSVIQLDMNDNFIKEWTSAVEVERELGINRKNISSCVHKKCKSAGGYKWVLKENYICSKGVIH